MSEDAATRKLVKGWQAGGVLNGPLFALDVPTNVADADGSETLAASSVASSAPGASPKPPLP